MANTCRLEDRKPGLTDVFAHISMNFQGMLTIGPRKRWNHFADVLDRCFECVFSRYKYNPKTRYVNLWPSVSLGNDCAFHVEQHCNHSSVVASLPRGQVQHGCLSAGGLDGENWKLRLQVLPPVRWGDQCCRPKCRARHFWDMREKAEHCGFIPHL